MAPIGGTTSSSQTGSSSSSQSALGAAGTPNESMFLQLLVAQMKNQDPESPSDPTQFVAQLAQFSELEQVIGIKQDLDAMKTAATTTSSTGGTDPTSSGNN